jgi:adenosylhomocysteine nucleosidase
MKVILFVALPSELPKELISNGIEVHYTGVGKINAAIKATETLKDLDSKDTIVINYGSAGGPEAFVGKLFKCKTFVQRDMDARPFAKKTITPFDSIIYPKLDDNECIEFGTGLTCYTQDKFEKKPLAVYDMESYSIAKVCKIYGFDFTAYKYVSDSGNPDDWEINHNKGIQQFLEILNSIHISNI